MDDFAAMQLCYSGSLPVALDCGHADLTGDGTVDEKDVTLMVQCGSGASIPPDPLCGDCNGDGIVDVRETEAELGEEPPDGLLVLGRPKCRNGDTTDCDDNCPCVFNPDQDDEDGDGIGDACEVIPAPPPPPDNDDDGVPDDLDNCPSVINPNQINSDTDELGDACDNCILVDNADQANMDGDLLGDVCDDDRDGDGLANDVDPCPDDWWTGDQDGDGIHDMCDPDMDGDGILDDGDNDGHPWYYTCTGGETTNCDDNCPLDVNPGQEDWNADGLGNACDPDPGEPPGGGEGLLGGDPLAMGMESGGLLGGLDLPMPEQGAMAYFVTNGGSEASVNLPGSGGTVVVDLIVAAAGPLDAWEGAPAVSAANMVSIDATGWSQEAELLAWSGLSSASPPSRYDCGELYWIIVSPQGSAVCQAWAGPICVDRLLESGAWAMTGSYGLDEITGPINTPAGAVYTTAWPLGGVTSRTIQGRAARVATLTLNVAGVPGTYQLTLTNGTWYSASMGETSPLASGPAFEIRVGGQ